MQDVPLNAVKLGPIVVSAPDARLISHDHDRDSALVHLSDCGKDLRDESNVFWTMEVIGFFHQDPVPIEEKAGAPREIDVRQPLAVRASVGASAAFSHWLPCPYSRCSTVRSTIDCLLDTAYEVAAAVECAPSGRCCLRGFAQFGVGPDGR